MSLFIGLDLGGTFLKYGLGEVGGSLLKKGKRPSRASRSAHEIFDTMFKALDEMLSVAKKVGNSVVGIGVGSPGVIDVTHGKLMGQSPNFQHWVDIEIKKTIEERFNLPVFVDNDANIMTIAEMKLGAGRGFRNSICLTIGTGIGGGIYINGELYRGYSFAGSELGHTIIEFNGQPCPCGGRGCLEQYASAPAIVRFYADALAEAGREIPSDATTRFIFSRLKEHDGAAVTAVEKACQYLGAGISSFVNALNPEVVIIGGGVADAGSIYINRVAEVVFERAMDTAVKGLQIRGAIMGNDAGIIGAILHAAKCIAES